MTPTVVLNGFDRSGSSMISRVLAHHPRIELIFQPFNSTNVRRRMYEVWDDGTATPGDIGFLEGLAEGRLETGYIASHWHARHSSTEAFVAGHLHVVKTTLNHLTARWMSERFPGLPMWGIWRDPVAILSSILRNGFFEEWYGDEAVRQLVATAAAHPDEFGPYASLRPSPDSGIQKTAYLIGARSWFLFRHVRAENVIVYERVRDDVNAALGCFTERFGLEPFDFSSFVQRDYNVVGQPLQEGRPAPSGHGIEQDTVRALFEPLLELAETRLGIEAPPGDSGA